MASGASKVSMQKYEIPRLFQRNGSQLSHSRKEHPHTLSMAIYLFRRIRFLMNSFLKSFRWEAFLLVLLLPGCSTVGDYLSGSSSTQQNPTFSYPKQISPIHIGKTTKEDLRQMLGEPMDVQVASLNEGSREAWAYPSQGEAINLFQFIPGFGVLALSHKVEDPSFSVSFSENGVVQGITLREIQSYDQGSVPFPGEKTPSVEFYGVNNPLVHLSKSQQS